MIVREVRIKYENEDGRITSWRKLVGREAERWAATMQDRLAHTTITTPMPIFAWEDWTGSLENLVKKED